jgi:hypothetical protein
MHTGIDQHGHPFIAKNTANKGDHVELLALIDVLAVPNVCGADVMMTSDFELKPLKLTVFEAADRDWDSVVEPPKWRNQRSVSDFKVQNIKADRELSADRSYKPSFTNVPLGLSEIEVALSDEEASVLEKLAATGKFGETNAEVLRYALFSWWIDRFMNGPKHAAPL